MSSTDRLYKKAFMISFAIRSMNDVEAWRGYGLYSQCQQKKGFVSVYETQSFIDPETNREKTRRVYIGHEDPVTGVLIPSSGKAGRKNNAESRHYKSSVPYKDDYEEALSELRKARNVVSELKQKLNEEMQYRDHIVSALESIIDSLNRLKSEL